MSIIRDVRLIHCWAFLMKTNMVSFFFIHETSCNGMAIPLSLKLAYEVPHFFSGVKRICFREKSVFLFQKLLLFILPCISTPAIATGPPISASGLFALVLIFFLPVIVGLLLVGKGRRPLFLLISVAVYALSMFAIFLAAFLLRIPTYIVIATFLSPWILIYIAYYLRVRNKKNASNRKLDPGTMIYIGVLVAIALTILFGWLSTQIGPM
jgi:hypothetical protein